MRLHPPAGVGQASRILATVDRNPPGLFSSTWYVGNPRCRSSAERMANILHSGWRLPSLVDQPSSCLLLHSLTEDQ